MAELEDGLKQVIYDQKSSKKSNLKNSKADDEVKDWLAKNS